MQIGHPVRIIDGKIMARILVTQLLLNENNLRFILLILSAKMLFAEQVGNCFYRIECYKRNLHKSGVPVAHCTVP
jgi:hypothetical protein